MRNLLRTALIVLALPSVALAFTYHASPDGAYKVAQEDLPPGTTNSNWHDNAVYLKGARNETLGFMLTIGNDTNTNATNMSVTMSSFSYNTDHSTGITSVVVSSGNVWNLVGRNIQQFLTHYLEIKGLSILTWGTYDEYAIPSRFRRPCTPSGGVCVPNGGTTWNDRPDHNKHYPEILVNSEIEPTFTVYASSSQGVFFDVYVPKGIQSGEYTSYIYVYQNSVLQVVIPVHLTVRNLTLTDAPRFKVMIAISQPDIAERMAGNRYPDEGFHVEPHYTRNKRAVQQLHAHGMIPIGDDNVTTNVPYPIDVARLNGTLYSAATGYYGRGQDTGDTMYSIGTYGSWSEWGTTTAAIVAHMTAWTTYFAANYPNVRAIWYIRDEDMTNVPAYSAAASTITVSGYKINHLVTYSWPDVRTEAPTINFPLTGGGWVGVSSVSWASAATHYLQGLTPGTTSAGGYNGNRPWCGSHNNDDDGVAFMAISWSALKLKIPYWFYWEANYYNNYQGGLGNTDLWNDAETFGGYSGIDSILGETGWNYGNGDGVLQYPGIDQVFTADSRGVEAFFPSIRLKLWRRAIQDGDYILAARDANASAANAIVQTRVPKVLYEVNCVEPSDCTYVYGPPSWSEDPEDFTTSREALAALIPSEGNDPYCGDNICNGSDTCSNCPQDCGVCPSGVQGKTFFGSYRMAPFNGSVR
jgi:hypothetical protein